MQPFSWPASAATSYGTLKRPGTNVSVHGGNPEEANGVIEFLRMVEKRFYNTTESELMSIYWLQQEMLDEQNYVPYTQATWASMPFGTRTEVSL